MGWDNLGFGLGSGTQAWGLSVGFLALCFQTEPGQSPSLLYGGLAEESPDTTGQSAPGKLGAASTQVGVDGKCHRKYTA